MHVPLVGNRVRLEPLTAEHAPGLLEVGRDPDIWTYLLTSMPTDRESMEAYLAPALKAEAEGTCLPFVIVDAIDGAIAGTTRLFDIRSRDRGAEIGHTWLGSRFQRTPFNAEAKFLLLRHAFDDLHLARVQLKTDVLNERSRRAIERIGARFEGVLRKYQLTQSGRVRDTAMYSITDDDWPAVRDQLGRLLQRG